MLKGTRLPGEMEVMAPMAPTTTSPDFHFSCAGPSSHASAPSSPKPFGSLNELYYCYTSAPASPGRAADIYSYFASNDEDDDYWEAKPMSAGQHPSDFDFGLGLPSELSTADQLFDKGQIRPSKPPKPEVQGKRSSGKGEEITFFTTDKKEAAKERGRERPSLSPSQQVPSRIRRESRSLPPSGGDDVSHKTAAVSSPSTATAASVAAPLVKSSGSKKWRLKDLLLFRSASEGRATGRGSKDPLSKYTLLSSSSSSSLLPAQLNKNKSADSGGSVKRGSGPPVSAHELHYTARRAEMEEQKKKTPLPYNRNNLFGCLHFNPAVRRLTRGFNTSGSFSRGRV